MFDLERAITAWKRPLERVRVISKEDLRELEAHLRDDYETLLDEGMTSEPAFRQAVRNLDDIFLIQQEYGKVFWQKSRHQGRITSEILITTSMLKNYIIVALRNIRRHKGYSFINVFGLAMGIGICLLLFLFIQKEFSFDQFHEKRNRIARVVHSDEGENNLGSYTSAEMGPLLSGSLTGIETAVRFRLIEEVLVGSDATGTERFAESAFLYADSTFFEVFSFELLRGIPETALFEPHSIVLTSSMADKYFPGVDPIGQAMLVGDEPPFTVTGVVQDPPDASSIQFNFLASYSTLRVHKSEAGMFNSGWGVRAYPTYVLLSPGTDAEQIQTSIKDLVLTQTEAEHIKDDVYTLELLPEHHFSSMDGSLGPAGDLRYLYIFGSIGLLILVVAGINFVNLSTARAMRRAREIGIRKAVGAHRALVVRQFLSESVITSLLALGLGIAMVALALPTFNAIVERSITFDQVGSLGGWSAMIVLVLVTGVIAGLYPALFLSRFDPARVLKGSLGTGTSGSMLRKGLVVFQFSISVFLLVGTIVVQQQLSFIDTKDLGLAREGVIAVPLKGSARTNALAVVENLNTVEGVEIVARAGGMPSRGTMRFGYEDENGELYTATVFPGDPQFMDAMGMKIMLGRGFSDDFNDASGRSATGGAVVNEAFVRLMGVDNPIGEELPVSPNGNKYRIIGVVGDFHYNSLVEQIQPAVIAPIEDYWNSWAVVRLVSSDYDLVLGDIKAAWIESVPDVPFEYIFLDESFDAFYKGPHKLARIFEAFSFMAIAIACLGLFGLASFTADQRTHEIGIRKVLGARVSGIVGLLTKDFLKLVALAFVLASPLAWFAMNRWLEGFAYRITIDASTYVIAALMTTLFALLTVSYQAVRAARCNPVQAMRRD